LIGNYKNSKEVDRKIIIKTISFIDEILKNKQNML
jgi:hypothetical protein